MCFGTTEVYTLSAVKCNPVIGENSNSFLIRFRTKKLLLTDTLGFPCCVFVVFLKQRF